MSGLFVISLWLEAHKAAEFTIFASTLRGAFSKASRKLESMEVLRKDVTCMVLFLKEKPSECHYKRFYDQGEPISPWLNITEDTANV